MQPRFRTADVFPQHGHRALAECTWACGCTNGCLRRRLGPVLMSWTQALGRSTSAREPPKPPTPSAAALPSRRRRTATGRQRGRRGCVLAQPGRGGRCRRGVRPQWHRQVAVAGGTDPGLRRQCGELCRRATSSGTRRDQRWGLAHHASPCKGATYVHAWPHPASHEAGCPNVRGHPAPTAAAALVHDTRRLDPLGAPALTSGPQRWMTDRRSRRLSSGGCSTRRRRCGRGASRPSAHGAPRHSGRLGGRRVCHARRPSRLAAPSAPAPVARTHAVPTPDACAAAACERTPRRRRGRVQRRVASLARRKSRRQVARLRPSQPFHNVGGRRVHRLAVACCAAPRRLVGTWRAAVCARAVR